MTRLRALLATIVLTASLATPAHADSEGGSLACTAGRQAKVEAFAAGPVTVIVNGRYSSSWAAPGHYRMVFAASGSSSEHYVVLNEDGWPILVIPYCGTW